MIRIVKWSAPVLVLAFGLALALKVQAEEAKKVETGSVNGAVVDQQGKAVASATVRLFHPMGGRVKPAKQAEGAEGEKPKAPKGDKPKPVAEATTDANGKFSIENVPVGDYVVRAGVKGQGRATGKVQVKAGETASIELKLSDVQAKKK